jgi:alginate O-acetyltransferase complex protein AlgI
MLFNSPEFILGFLPATLILFFLIARQGANRLAIGWLFTASLVFYGWWNPANLLILLSSIAVNFGLGMAIAQAAVPLIKRGWLLLGLTLNLGLIGYFKYADFALQTVNGVFATNVQLGEILLPLGISFFTFQQIAYLIDRYREPTDSRYRWLDYGLFVAFFPQLIAGPLLHHQETISQFTRKTLFRLQPENLAIGLTIFAVGLFKKVVLADTVAVYATQIFDAAADGESLSLLEAWIGALSYSLQLYFDFSGYSDMAIGLAFLFNLRLPINFNSPYKATNISDFWRRWHITLSNYLRDYVYIPLGGSRKGEWRRNVNLLLTMLLCGLWHGAGWTFVLWGGLHGVYLLIHHQWRSQRSSGDSPSLSVWQRECSWLLTFLAVVAGWVIFRAPDLPTAAMMLKSMACGNGISLPESWSSDFLQTLGVRFDGWLPNLSIEVDQIDDVTEVEPTVIFIVLAVQLLIVRCWPNTQQWIDYGKSIPDRPPVATLRQRLAAKLRWQPTHGWAILSALMTAIALLNLAKVSEFLYFEF